MLSVRFMLVLLALIFLGIAGLFGWALIWVYPFGVAVFILAWFARPVDELRRAVAGFREKLLLKQDVQLDALLMGIALTLGIYLAVPLLTYGTGRLLGMVIGAVINGL